MGFLPMKVPLIPKVPKNQQGFTETVKTIGFFLFSFFLKET